MPEGSPLSTPDLDLLRAIPDTRPRFRPNAASSPPEHYPVIPAQAGIQTPVIPSPSTGEG